MPKLQFWFEFASTYSYLTAMRIEPLCAAAGVDLEWCPFLLGPIFKAQGLDSSPFNVFPAKGAHMWRDMVRIAAARGLPPITRPDPFPQNGLLAARVATIGARRAWGPDFVRAVYHGQFAERATISDPQWIGEVLVRLGLPADGILTQAQTDATTKETLRHRTETAQAKGLFGAPSFLTEDGELFWGDDRLEAAVAWAVDPQSIPAP